jgi:dTDP-4-amino-4,6-dideoxygalactose transaminase
MQTMLDAGIATRRGVMCAHREAAYAGAVRRSPLPESEQAQDRAIILPLYHSLSQAEQERVVEALRAACAGAVGASR